MRVDLDRPPEDLFDMADKSCVGVEIITASNPDGDMAGAIMLMRLNAEPVALIMSYELLDELIKQLQELRPQVTYSYPVRDEPPTDEEISSVH